MDASEFNKTFDELMVFLQNRNTIEQTKHFLEQNGVNMNVRKFLGFFMIYYQKDELLDENEISQELYKQISRLIRVYTSLRNEYKEFKLKIFHYVTEETSKWFDIWKKRDKYNLLIPMIHMYHHLEEQKTSDQEWNTEIDKQKELLKTKIFKLEPNNDIAQNLLDNPPRIEINKETRDNIVNVIHKAYWDKFQKSVKDKEWGQLIGFVEEIKTIFKELIPHRQDLHQEIDDKLDTEILKQRLDANLMETESIFDLISYIVEWIRQFQAPIDDSDTEEWFEHLKRQTSWDILMRDFFMVTFAKLDKIKIVISTIYKK